MSGRAPPNDLVVRQTSRAVQSVEGEESRGKLTTRAFQNKQPTNNLKGLLRGSYILLGRPAPRAGTLCLAGNSTAQHASCCPRCSRVPPYQDGPAKSVNHDKQKETKAAGGAPAGTPCTANHALHTTMPRTALVFVTKVQRARTCSARAAHSIRACPLHRPHAPCTCICTCTCTCA